MEGCGIYGCSYALYNRAVVFSHSELCIGDDESCRSADMEYKIVDRVEIAC